MLQETRDKGRKIKTDRGELDIYRMCFTSEETEARSGKVAYRVMHTVELGGKTLISFSALGTYCVGGTAEGEKRDRDRVGASVCLNSGPPHVHVITLPQVSRPHVSPEWERLRNNMPGLR